MMSNASSGVSNSLSHNLQSLGKMKSNRSSGASSSRYNPLRSAGGGGSGRASGGGGGSSLNTSSYSGKMTSVNKNNILIRHKHK